MDELKNFLKNHQQKIVLLIGYLLVALLAFSVGRFTVPKIASPEISAPEAFAVPNNYTPSTAGIQSENITQASIKSSSDATNCEGKIKGTSTFIYHLPGGAFYDRVTKPIKCFDTEIQATAAGFRKSSK